MKSGHIQSIDPRVNRLPQAENTPKAPLDQFATYEVFVQPAPGKPFRHEGAVHAPGLEMAYVLAKETFTRRFTCSSLSVANTRHVHILAPDPQETVQHAPPAPAAAHPATYEVYHLSKRGKQPVQAGTVTAATPQQALQEVWEQCHTSGKIMYAVWIIDHSNIRFTLPDEQDFWLTLPDKKFRDATDYKGGDKLKQFLDTAVTPPTP
jgi:ring-1,2-phenylacetyl-CoA epoxidase subunit PaaB